MSLAEKKTHNTYKKMDAQTEYARKIIEGVITDFFVEKLDFKKRGRKFYKNLDGIQLSAQIERGQYGRYCSLTYYATLVLPKDPKPKYSIRTPDIQGQFGSISGESEKITWLLNAENPIESLHRRKMIYDLLNVDAEQWYEKLDTPEEMSVALKRYFTERDKGYIPLASGMLKIGIDPHA